MVLEEFKTNGLLPFWIRYQTVKINGKLMEIITCDVPQGSFTSKMLRFVIFADDTSTYLAGKNIKEKIYTQELKNVVTWLNGNKLSLSTDKSNCILFWGPRRNIKHNTTIEINNVEIKEKEYRKSLGVLIDKKVSWIHHIKRANPSKGIGILTKLL